MATDHPQASQLSFLGTVEGEITFFRSIMRARPVGIHRHFHLLTIRNAIYKDTGRLVTPDDIWDKLRTCYDIDALEAIDIEADHFEIGTSSNSTPISIPSPSPSENLDHHPFFREEYTLPLDQTIESLIAQRRMRNTPSAPSSPEPTPPPQPRKRARRGKNKLDMAGLVGGDSDSSALTQESGDERVPPTPRDSVMTGTEAGSEDGEEEGDAEQGRSLSPSTKPARGRTKGIKGVKKGAPSARGRVAKTAPRTSKKKKR